jgi:predicted RNA methylase
MHLYSNGVFNARHNGKSIYKLVSNSYQIENEIYWHGLEGSHEKKSLAIFMKYIEIFKPEVVYDIGANTGTYGIIAKVISPESKVYFFELLSSTMSIVKHNLAINNF